MSTELGVDNRVERKHPYYKGIIGTIKSIDAKGRALVKWDRSTGTRENKSLTKWIKLKSIKKI